MATGVTGLAWTACGLLLAVASLGMTLVFVGIDSPPAGRPPALVIAAHITAAVTTILLATLAAIGPG